MASKAVKVAIARSMAMVPGSIWSGRDPGRSPRLANPASGSAASSVRSVAWSSRTIPGEDSCRHIDLAWSHWSATAERVKWNQELPTPLPVMTRAAIPKPAAERAPAAQCAGRRACGRLARCLTWPAIFVRCGTRIHHRGHDRKDAAAAQPGRQEPMRATCMPATQRPR